MSMYALGFFPPSKLNFQSPCEISVMLYYYFLCYLLVTLVLAFIYVLAILMKAF